eukprot:3932010-Rhodomonas_salina.2
MCSLRCFHPGHTRPRHTKTNLQSAPPLALGWRTPLPEQAGLVGGPGCAVNRVILRTLRHVRVGGKCVSDVHLAQKPVASHPTYLHGHSPNRILDEMCSHAQSREVISSTVDRHVPSVEFCSGKDLVVLVRR